MPSLIALKSRHPEAQRALSLRDQAYEAIKHRIITCELKPGEVLSEAVLSADLGIGRTPMRQAIDRLVGDGLVEVMPRKGSIVKPVTLDEILNIIDVRVVNESFCVRLAAAREDAGFTATLRANIEAMHRAAKEREIEAIARLDQEFHALIAGATRNGIMIDLLRNLHERSARLWFISLRANEQHLRIVDEHAAIVDGIAAHDADAAEAAMRRHVESFRSNIARQV